MREKPVMRCFFDFSDSCEGEVKTADGVADSPWSGCSHVDSTFGYCRFHQSSSFHRSIWEHLYVKRRGSGPSSRTRRNAQNERRVQDAIRKAA